MKTTSVTLSELCSSHISPEQPKAFSLKKPARSQPKHKNLFSLAREIELERRGKHTKEKIALSSQSKALEHAFLEKALITQETLLSSMRVTSQAPATSAIIEAILEKVSYQIENGVEKTSIFFGKSEKNPSLQGTEIHIMRYDTDPLRFHIELASSPQGVLVLSSEMGNLRDHLRKQFPDQFFSIAKPCLNTYSRKHNLAFLEKVNKNTKKSLF